MRQLNDSHKETEIRIMESKYQDVVSPLHKFPDGSNNVPHTPALLQCDPATPIKKWGLIPLS